MPPRRIPSLGLAVALLLPLRAFATTVEPPAFPELVGQSDYVVRGTVAAISSEWREYQGRKYIASQVEIQVSEVVKGAPPARVVLQLVGGRIGEDELRIEGAPKFQIGEEDIFFVKANGSAIFPLFGIMHGLYPILHDFKTGQDFVLRSNGMPLYSEQDVSLPMSRLSDAKVNNPATSPLTADAFIRLIRRSPVRPTPSTVEY
jgi:hypothetical protein